MNLDHEVKNDVTVSVLREACFTVEDLGVSGGKTEIALLQLEFKHAPDLNFERLTTLHTGLLRQDGKRWRLAAAGNRSKAEPSGNRLQGCARLCPAWSRRLASAGETQHPA
jgi:hypothetical protein